MLEVRSTGPGTATMTVRSIDLKFPYKSVLEANFQESPLASFTKSANLLNKHLRRLREASKSNLGSGLGVNFDSFQRSGDGVRCICFADSREVHYPDMHKGNGTYAIICLLSALSLLLHFNKMLELVDIRNAS